MMTLTVLMMTLTVLTCDDLRGCFDSSKGGFISECALVHITILTLIRISLSLYDGHSSLSTLTVS